MELYYDIKYVNHDFRMVHSMADMITNKQLTDCSLVAEGKTLRAHRVVLAAASEYLLNAFCSLPEDEETETTVCIFDNIPYKDIFNVVKFIYTGKITLNEEDTVSFINVGNMLKVRGIIGIGIDINKEKTTLTSQNEAGTSKGVKRPHDDDNDDIEEDPLMTQPRHDDNDEEDDSLPMTQPPKRKRKQRVFRECVAVVTDSNDSDRDDSMRCTFCMKGFHNKSTLNNHERFCEKNPNRKLSTCPICGMIVKPGSMTFHKKSVHGYIPKSRKRQPKGKIISTASVMNIDMKAQEGVRKSRRIEVANRKAPIETAPRLEEEQRDTTATADELNFE